MIYEHIVSLQTDSRKIHELRKSDKYSTVFNVILNEIPMEEVETAERQRGIFVVAV